MKKATRYSLVMGLLLVACAALAQQEKDPVYVGVEVCSSCHRGPGMGHQHSKWLLSKHARAYAVLAMPESRQIAQLSGIVQEPQESAMCLGCHATGAEAEEWEKDDTFHIEDGVQCEKCHGPGSEYMDAETMTDPEAAMKAGLRMPVERDCLVCHIEKGSHVAVHKSAQLDIQEALATIAHTTPENWTSGADIGREGATDEVPGYVGATACGSCHAGPVMGYQYSKWRLSGHSRSYAILATPEAYEVAKGRGIEGSPQESDECLKCHAPADALLEEGVSCEVCHGAGSEYMPEAVMMDPTAAREAGLKTVTKETCVVCHYHDRFDYEEYLEKIAHPNTPPQVAEEEPRYKTPLNLAISPDSRELYVACESSGSVIVVDVGEKRSVAEIATGRQPTDVTFSPDGSRVYVSNRFEDTVSVIDVSSRQVIRRLAVGDDPHGVLVDATGKQLFVLNTSEDSISIFDTESFEEVKRLRASRAPWSLAMSPDGERLFVTNTLSRFVEFREPSMSEVTFVDPARGVVQDRYVVPAANIVQGVAWHPSGDYAFVTLNRTKNLVPMTRLMQGWTITNGMGVVWKDGRVAQVLLDEPHLCFPDPADVAVTPDGNHVLVTSSGSDRVAVVDVAKLIAMLEASSEEELERVIPNHLGKPTEFVVTHVETGKSPRGVLVTPDGKTAFVADALDDTVTVIDMERFEATERIDLGGSKTITDVRFGEQLFHSADITFHRQFSCHTCHPDGHVDGITYDIEPDGLGVSPVDNRTLRGILDTAPFKWEGTNPSLSRQCGPRLAVFFTRIQPFTPEELSALTTYIATIPRPLNRYRPLGAPLTEAQRRGKKVFERTMANDGRILPTESRCVTCHPPPLYTDRSVRDVGTEMLFDRESRFDVPHLNNIYGSSPYLHNGIAETLEEIWTRFNPDDRHGVTNDLTKDELNDLIEFLKTL